MTQNSSQLPAWLDGTVLRTAFELCVESYVREDKPCHSDAKVRLVQSNQINESIFRGSILGRVYLSDDTAYVVFRGTKMSIPNLALTNFQAVTCRHLVLDDELVGSTRILHQGGEFQQVLPGEVHQGFARAASRLWYGSDLLAGPYVGEESEDADLDSVFIRRRLRHTVFLLLGGALGFLASNASYLTVGWVVAVTVLSAMFGTLSMAAWESGFLESLVRIRPKRLKGSVELRKGLPDLISRKRVIFVGHSLGGSIAALCFAIYRRLSIKRKVPQVVGLLTAGAPRVGSQAWVTAFEGEHRGHHLHFVHDRDWVPHVPPASQAVDQFGRLFKCGPVGVAILVLNPLWRWLYEFGWRPKPYADFSEASQSVRNLPSPKGWLTFFGNHRIAAYMNSALRGEREP